MVTHRLRRAARALVLVLAALWALGACAVTQELTVRADRSGETVIAIDLAPDFVARVKEMAALADIELPDEGMINLETLHETLAALPGVTVTQVEAPEENLLDLAFSFEDAPAMFPSPSLLWEAGIVDLRGGGWGRRTPAPEVTPLPGPGQLQAARADLPRARRSGDPCHGAGGSPRTPRSPPRTT